jgi:hypothetical protein
MDPRVNILADLHNTLTNNPQNAGLLDRMYAKAAVSDTNNWANIDAIPQAKPQADETPLWMKALEGLSASGKAVTNQIGNWTDGQLNWKDIPQAENTWLMAKGQWDAWKDGKLGWSDIPGFGMLYGIGHNGKGFDRTLENLGAEKGGALSKWGGLAGDILLDPLTYATLGAGSMTKAGKVAQLAKATELAGDAGIQAGRKAAQTVPESIFDATKSRYAANPNINQDLAERLAIRKFDDATKQIADAGSAARNRAQNAAFNLDIPFTNITKQFGTKPLSLQKFDAKIGATGAAAVSDLFRSIGMNPDELDHANQIQNVLEKTYGTRNAAELTTQAKQHLEQYMNDFKSKYISNQGTAKNFLNGHDITEELKTLFQPNLSRSVDYKAVNPNEILQSLDPRIADRIAPMIEGMSKPEITPAILGSQRAMTGSLNGAPDAMEFLGEALGKMPGTVKGKTAEAIKTGLNDAASKFRNAENTAKVSYDPFTQIKDMVRSVKDKPYALKTADEFLSQIRPFVQDAGGKSAFGNKASKFNPFDTRSFRSADALANKAAGDLRDIQGKITGQTRQMDEQLKHLAGQTKDWTETEKKALVYHIEDAFPQNFNKNSVDMTKIDGVAQQMQTILKQLGQRDLNAGTIKDLLKNYFPHVINKQGADFSKFAGDADIARVLGKSQANNFGKAREGFDNMAQLDDAVGGLEQEAKTAQAAGNSAEFERLTAKAEELKGIFHRDPVEALGYRAYKSIRSSAYADLFGQFEKDGLLVRKSADANLALDRARHAGMSDYKKLDANEAAAMGLEAGDQIHPDIFKGMQDVREMFTSQGMNKFVDGVNKVVSVWKSLVTSYVPAHYLNNFIGNLANSTLAGVKPESYAEAGKLLKAWKAGKLDAEQSKIIQAAYEKGVFGQGFSSDFVKSQYATKEKSWTDKITHNGYAKWMRNKGDAMDDFSRMATFLHGYHSTGSFDQAGEMVRKFLFNYNEMNSADRMARSVIPFWTWTKNNLPLQLQQLMQQPRYYQTYKRVLDTFNADVNENTNRSYTHTDYLKIPGMETGLPLRAMPLNDLGKVHGNPLDVLREAMGMLNPVAKVPIEAAANKQFFNNQPIYHPTGNKQGAEVSNYILNQTGILDKIYESIKGTAQGDFMAPIDNLITGKRVQYKQ